MKNKKKYDANFTAGGLLYVDFSAIISILTSENFIEEIQNEIKLNSLLGIRSESVRKRVVSEIGRGLDISEKIEGRFNVASLDQTKRKCKSCELTFIK